MLSSPSPTTDEQLTRGTSLLEAPTKIGRFGHQLPPLRRANLASERHVFLLVKRPLTRVVLFLALCHALIPALLAMLIVQAAPALASMLAAIRRSLSSCSLLLCPAAPPCPPAAADPSPERPRTESCSRRSFSSGVSVHIEDTPSPPAPAPDPDEAEGLEANLRLRMRVGSRSV
ncbi:hypothetical protein ACCO45_006978 [Purpureocillium lilacinum]|uniref:Uncharacterized protein n=1 Tax=Purpureocillium lilacinum TaxID=33203 RepID=A0ACC4DR21_PURLI